MTRSIVSYLSCILSPFSMARRKSNTLTMKSSTCTSTWVSLHGATFLIIHFLEVSSSQAGRHDCNPLTGRIPMSSCNSERQHVLFQTFCGGNLKKKERSKKEFLIGISSLWVLGQEGGAPRRVEDRMSITRSCIWDPKYRKTKHLSTRKEYWPWGREERKIGKECQGIDSMMPEKVEAQE